MQRGRLQIDEDSKEVQVVAFNYARLERQFFDKELEADFNTLQAAAPDGCEVSVVSRTRSKDMWVVSFRRDDGPTEFLLYDKANGGKITPLFVSSPALLEYKFAKMEDVRI